MSLPGQQSVGPRDYYARRNSAVLQYDKKFISNVLSVPILLIALIYDDLEVYPFADVIESKKNTRSIKTYLPSAPWREQGVPDEEEESPVGLEDVLEPEVERVDLLAVSL